MSWPRAASLAVAGATTAAFALGAVPAQATAAPILVKVTCSHSVCLRTEHPGPSGTVWRAVGYTQHGRANYRGHFTTVVTIGGHTYRSRGREGAGPPQVTLTGHSRATVWVEGWRATSPGHWMLVGKTRQAV